MKNHCTQPRMKKTGTSYRCRGLFLNKTYFWWRSSQLKAISAQKDRCTLRINRKSELLGSQLIRNLIFISKKWIHSSRWWNKHSPWKSQLHRLLEQFRYRRWPAPLFIQRLVHLLLMHRLNTKTTTNMKISFSLGQDADRRRIQACLGTLSLVSSLAKVNKLQSQ